MISCITAQILPLIPILATHRPTVLIINIVWFSLMPHSKVKGSTSCPLPLTLNIKITCTYPVSSVNITIKHGKSLLDKIMFLLTAWLSQVPMVSHTALHRLEPVKAVVVVSSPTAVVITALNIVALTVAVWVVRATAPVWRSTTSRETGGISIFLEYHVALVGPFRSVYPAIIRITASSCLSGPVHIRYNVPCMHCS